MVADLPGVSARRRHSQLNRRTSSTTGQPHPPEDAPAQPRAADVAAPAASAGAESGGEAGGSEPAAGLNPEVFVGAVLAAAAGAGAQGAGERTGPCVVIVECDMLLGLLDQVCAPSSPSAGAAILSCFRSGGGAAAWVRPLSGTGRSNLWLFYR